MSTTNLKSKIILGLLVVVVVIGLAAAIYQVQQGLIVTNMRNSFSWGLYIVMWAFLVGIATGGLMVTSSIYLFNIERLKPFSRVTALVALIATLAAMVVLLLDLGRPDRVFNMLIHPQFGSALIWDFIALTLCAIFAICYIFIQVRPDIARKGIKLPLVGVIGTKDLSREALERMEERSERWARLIAPLVLVIAILAQIVEAWVFATQLSRTWWFGGALAPSFIASAIASGVVVIILASLYTLRHKKGLDNAYTSLGKIAAIGALALLLIYYGDLVVKAWWGAGLEFETVKLFFTRYYALHIVEVLLIAVAIFLIVKRAASKGWLIAGSLSMAFGILVHKYLLMPLAFNIVPLDATAIGYERLSGWAYPISVGEIASTLDNPSSLFVSFWSYSPSAIEWMASVGLLAAAILAFILLSRIMPIIPITKEAK
jgi:molybdopterin-containing oxidoreductase family membrane subunit